MGGPRGRGGKGRAARPARGTGASKKQRRWDDPDSDDEGSDDEEDRDANLERMHAKWAEDGGDDDEDEDEDAAVKGSDSEGENADIDDSELKELLKRAAPQKQKKPEETIWDPLADLGPRKKMKVAPTIPGSFDMQDSRNTTVAGIAEGATVCLHGLLKAPQLNGKTGLIVSPVDGATGRCQVLLEDMTVKSLRQDNMREVLTGAVVRIKGLQSAAELNGKLAECGILDLKTSRYSVHLADGLDTEKRIKPDNLEMVRRFIRPMQMLSVHRRPFKWDEVLTKLQGREYRTWAAQLSLIRELGLPAPQLIKGEALTKFARSHTAESKAARAAMLSDALGADKAPVDGDGLPAFRLLGCSLERDSCCPASFPRDEDLRRLGEAAAVLAERDSVPFLFLVPTLCVKPLSCLRASAACAWPLYLQLCTALVSVESEHRAAKAWCRVEQLLAGTTLSKPVYILPVGGASKQNSKAATASGSEAWLLSSKAENVVVSAPGDGQVLPGEKALLEKMAGEALSGGWRKGESLTCYRL